MTSQRVRVTRTDDQRRLPLGVRGGDHVLVGGQPGGVAAGTAEPVVHRQQLLDLPFDPDPAAGQHHNAIADAFKIGDQMGGEHDAESVLRDRLHEILQELAAGERVERGDGLVEEQQLRPLGQAQREGELGALAARQLAGPLPGVQAEAGDPVAGQGVVPAGVEPGAEAEVVGDGQRGVDGGVLGDVTDLGELAGTAAGAAAAHLDRARGGGEHPGGQIEQRRFARAVGADEAGHVPGRDVERAAVQRGTPSEPLGQRPSPDARSLVGGRAGRSAAGLPLPGTVTLCSLERRRERWS